jgi:eukaryotic-like serine/threonine-protein kinase
MAYVSDESGRNEIYVQPFPPTGKKWRVSDNGGGNPISWRRDGKEIYYVNARKITSVEVSTAAAPGQLALRKDTESDCRRHVVHR